LKINADFKLIIKLKDIRQINTVLFRVWQMALADSTMSTDEINGILRSCYGEDLGYNSDDAEYEYYSK
jgi:hypothetical protein